LYRYKDIILARQIRTRRRTYNNVATQTGQLHGRVEKIKNKTNRNEDIKRLNPATYCFNNVVRRREIMMHVNANN